MLISFDWERKEYERWLKEREAGKFGSSGERAFSLSLSLFEDKCLAGIGGVAAS